MQPSSHAPDEVGQHYRAADTWLLRDRRMLKVAMIAAWRADRDDQLPDGQAMLFDGLEVLRLGS